MRKRQRQASLPGFELGDYIREAIGFLRAHEPSEGYFMGFSGGKDSITALELCRMAGVKHQAFYSCTGIDPPEMYAFIRKHYTEVIWMHPKTSFYDYIQIASPPMIPFRRWCCNHLKKNPTRHIHLKARIMGIRAEESPRRAARPRCDKYNRNQILYKPIFYWPEWAVWDFIDERGLPYPSLYDEGAHRIGCVVCPFLFGPGEAAQRRIAWSQKRWPGIWEAFRHAVFRWFDAKMTQGLRHGQRFKTAEEFWQAYIRGGRIK